MHNQNNTITKKHRIFNYVFTLIMFVITLVMAIIIWSNKDSDNASRVRLLGPLIIIPLIYLLEIILRVKFSNSVVLFYNIYVFFASFLGTAFAFYAKISIYDNIMHTLFGYVGCVGGLYLLTKLSDYKNMSVPFVMIMTFFVSMGCGSIWEIIEYTCDNLFGSNCQGNPAAGVVPLEDTIWDIINNFIGAIVFQIHYFVHRISKRKLLMGNLVEDFLNN